MRKVFVDNLPKHKNKGIDWINTKGMYVDFIYDDISGKIYIKDIINEKPKYKQLLVSYDSKETIIDVNSFKNANLGCIIGTFNRDFVYNIGDVIQDSKRNVTVIDRKRIDENNTKRKAYKLLCNNCHCESNFIKETSIVNKHTGCPVCSRVPTKIVVGINDIATTDPWMVDYFFNKDDGFKYTSGSERKIPMICPYCKKQKNVKINQLKRDKYISCICNSSNVSYPERFFYNLLEQLKIEYVHQYSPNWACGKKYDFYLKDYSIIVEMDGGLGHGYNNYRNISMTPDKSKYIDEYKDALALKCGIRVIRINCLKSTMEYIRNSILNSNLCNYIDFSNVNWGKCAIDATKNVVYEVCKYKNEHPYLLLKDIYKHFKISSTTLTKYLNEGNKFGWCYYDKFFEIEKRFTKICVDDKYYFSSQQYLSDKSQELFGKHWSINNIQNHLNNCIDKHYIKPIYDFKYYYEIVNSQNSYVYDRYMDKYGDTRVFGI